MDTSATNRRLRLLLTGLTARTLLPRPEFQRRLVWNNADKLAFIQTVLEGLPFPEIYLAIGDLNSETGEGTELLVDGQQRLTTLNEYFRGSTELKYGRSRYGKEIRPYVELTEPEKTAFLEYEVVVRDLGKLPEEQVREIFKRINSANYALNAMEVRNARYAGEFIQAAAKISANPLFLQHKVFTTNDVRRMQDTRYALVLLVTVMSTYLNLDRGIEEYLEKFNENFEDGDRLLDEIRRILASIKVMKFPAKSRAWRKADLFTLIVELHRAKYKRHFDFDIVWTGGKLDEFYERVDEEKGDSEDPVVKTYFLSAFQGTNLKANRVRRGEIIQKVIDPDYVFDQRQFEFV